MYQCKICSITAKSQNVLTAHIRISHSLTKKEYYDEYIKTQGEGECLTCSSPTTFRGSHYLRFCSRRCHEIHPSTAEQRRNAQLGKKQSKDTIERRIANTDQKKKQAKREDTLLERYDNIHYNNPKKIGESNKGRKQPPRTEEWSRNIIESKRKNGTLNHREDTKSKISVSINNLYQSDDPPVTISKSGKYQGRGHSCGYYNEIYYRSSYELRLLEYCFKHDIKILSADTKEFRVKYEDESGKSRYYYPDFYLPEHDIILEVKPLSMLEVENITLKTNAAMKEYDFVLVTEDELEDLETFFKLLLT